jgi:hypothetical protein
MRWLFALVLFVLLLAPGSFGWNGFGHMAVAYQFLVTTTGSQRKPGPWLEPQRMWLPSAPIRAIYC